MGTKQKIKNLAAGGDCLTDWKEIAKKTNKKKAVYLANNCG
jgi:hypothetical protein